MAQGAAGGGGGGGGSTDVDDDHDGNDELSQSAPQPHIPAIPGIKGGDAASPAATRLDEGWAAASRQWMHELMGSRDMVAMVGCLRACTDNSDPRAQPHPELLVSHQLHSDPCDGMYTQWACSAYDGQPCCNSATAAPLSTGRDCGAAGPVGSAPGRGPARAEPLSPRCHGACITRGGGAPHCHRYYKTTNRGLCCRPEPEPEPEPTVAESPDEIAARRQVNQMKKPCSSVGSPSTLTAVCTNRSPSWRSGWPLQLAAGVRMTGPTAGLAFLHCPSSRIERPCGIGSRSSMMTSVRLLSRQERQEG